jgi:hypothetical protein
MRVVAGFAAMAMAVSVAAAQRTFVSTNGDDLNACSLAAPCRSFAKAMTQTATGGEIVVQDSGGYGAVTVDKDVAINAPPGVYAGISVFAGQVGVDVVSPAANVVLRGLTINGQGGNIGLRVQSGNVHVENVVVAGIGTGIQLEGGTLVRIAGTVVRNTTEAVRVVPATGTLTVLVRDSEFSDSGTAGIHVSPAGAGSALVTLENTSIAKSSGYGIYADLAGGGTATIVVTKSVVSEHGIAGVAGAGAGATTWVRDSAVSRNAVGLQQAASAVLHACGANLLVANGSAMTGTIDTSSCLDVAAGTGTVTSVATGTGLTGGPITGSGTIDLAATQLLPPTACGVNEVPRWSGSAWTCAAAGGAGTVTSVATGTGLTGGPITGSGTIDLAATQLLPPIACGANEVPQWSGSAWACAALAGDVTGAVNANTVSGLQGRPLSASAPASGQMLGWNGSAWKPTTPPVAGGPTVSGWAGLATTLPAGMAGLVFSGPTVALAVPAGSRLTGSASVPMATGGGTTNVTMGLCYQFNGGVLTLFAGAANAQLITVNTNLSMYSTHSSVGSLPSGIYTVGLCARNTGALHDVSTVDHVNGWAMVTSS